MEDVETDFVHQNIGPLLVQQVLHQKSLQQDLH
jgi:hypothetical protein